MYWEFILFVILGSASIITAFLLYGSFRWEAETERIRSALEAGRLAAEPETFETHELADLPPTVQQYFRTVLTIGQSLVTTVSMEHKGFFNVSETGDNWRRFTADQRIITRRPGFDWDARIQMFPGVEVRVHDAYISGEGIMHAALFGVVPIAGIRGSLEMSRGQLMRYFAEAVWYPTALLPSQGVAWQPVDDRTARATLVEENIILTLIFRFNERSLIESVRAEARGRTVENKIIPTPWEGRWRSYRHRNGMYIPMEGEVAWLLDEGPKPYWRGSITRINFDFAR